MRMQSRLAATSALTVAICGLAGAALAADAASRAVEVSNPSLAPRSGASVTLDAHALGLDPTAPWSVWWGKTNLPVQTVDQDGDGVVDGLVVALDMPSHGRAQLRLVPQASPAVPSAVQAIMALRVGATFNGKAWIGGHFENFDHVDLPPSHVAGDKLTVYDGPAWESDKIGFRIYLDQRNAIDLFGKRQAPLVLQRIGRGVGDYHKLEPWGMDILHVTDSLGAGGLGVIENGHVRQVGAAQGGVAAKVLANGPLVASLRVDNKGLTATSGVYDLTARYSIAAGARVTTVEARASALAPIVAGIEKREGVTVLRSPSGKSGGWAYVATYGQQSFIQDGLGIAVFYPIAEAAEVGDDGRTAYIRFKNPSKIRYAFAAAWAQEQGGVTDQAGFVRFLDQELARLDQPVVVKVRSKPKN